MIKNFVTKTTKTTDYYRTGRLLLGKIDYTSITDPMKKPPFFRELTEDEKRLRTVNKQGKASRMADRNNILHTC